jgi:hypothetical protein
VAGVAGGTTLVMRFGGSEISPPGSYLWGLPVIGAFYGGITGHVITLVTERRYDEAKERCFVAGWTLLVTFF